MTQTLLALGSQPGDGTGTPGRAGGGIINANFNELYQNAFYFGSDTGAVNACVMASCLPQPLNFTLQVGAIVHFSPAFANTGPATFAFLTSGAQPIVNPGGLALVGNELQPANITTLQFNGVAWQILYVNNATLLNQLITTFVTYPETPAETQVQLGLGRPIIINPAYPPLSIDRYGSNSVPGATPMDVAGQVAQDVALIAGGQVTYGLTAPYLFNNCINCTWPGQGGAPGVSWVNIGDVSDNLAHGIIAIHNQVAVFDCTGNDSIQFIDPCIKAPSPTNFPKCGILLSRNSNYVTGTTGASLLNRVIRGRFTGNFGTGGIYNYGSENSYIEAPYIDNTNPAGNTDCIVYTANNISNLQSVVAGLTPVRPQSCTVHDLIAPALLNSGASASSNCVRLDVADALHWEGGWADNAGTGAGRAIVYVDQTYATSSKVSLRDIELESTSPDVSNFVLFGAAGSVQQPVGWTVSGIYSVTSSNFMASVDANTHPSAFTINGVTELNAHGINFPGTVTGSMLTAQIPVTINLLTNSYLAGIPANWVLGGSLNNTLVSTVGGLSGTATFVAATTVAVTFASAATPPNTNYKVALGGNVAGFCWVTAKTLTGFTINCSVSNSNTTDWSVTMQ